MTIPTISQIMEKVANLEFANTIGKLYEYNIFDSLYSGICEVLSITYNSHFKSFDFVIRDIDTFSVYMIDRCNIHLKRKA